MAYTLENFKKDKFILTSLVMRDFKLKYRRSVLGIVWSVLNPLLMMIVIAAVFAYMFRFDIEHFAVYLILGQTIFNLMSASTGAGVTSIISAAPLIKKIRVNKVLFPLETVLFELLNFALSLIAVAIVMAFYQIMPTLNLLFLPLLVFYVVVFCVGLSLLLSALAVFFRDVIYLWGVVLIAWTYATPLFYPYEALPDFMKQVMLYNPMYHYVTYFRDIALYGTTPSLIENLICIGMALAMLALGYLVFRRTERKFILHV
jgi:ABC-2 type transport system permease protein